MRAIIIAVVLIWGGLALLPSVHAEMKQSMQQAHTDWQDGRAYCQALHDGETKLRPEWRQADREIPMATAKSHCHLLYGIKY